MSEEKPKANDFGKELLKCSKGGLHFLEKHGDMDNWMCRKCKKDFTEEEAFFIKRD